MVGWAPVMGHSRCFPGAQVTAMISWGPAVAYLGSSFPAWASGQAAFDFMKPSH